MRWVAIGLVLAAAPAGASDWRWGSTLYRDANGEAREAIDSCVAAIESQARERAPFAQVTGVTTLAHVGARFSINGRVMVGPEKHVFRCRVVRGAFERATIDEAI
jgi:hypothetical protein